MRAPRRCAAASRGEAPAARAPSRRSQSFASGERAARRVGLGDRRAGASARSRSRSVGARSSGHVSAESGRRDVARATSSGVEDRGDLLPERARLARRAVVGRRLADEVEAPRRARAGGVEEVAVAADLVGALEPRRRARGARRRRGTARCASGAAASPPRARARTRRRSAACARAAGRARRPARPRPPRRAAPRRARARRRTSSRSTSPPSCAPAVELVEQPQGRVVGAQVEPRGLARRRRLGAVGGAEHRPRRARARPSTGASAAAQLGERRHRRLAQLLGLLLDARRRVDRAPAQPALDEVDRRARPRPEYGERRNAKSSRRPAVEPRVAQELQQRMAERRRAEPRAATRPRTGCRAPPSTVSSGARQRSSDGATSAISLGATPAADEARAAPRRRARACRARRRPRRSGRRRRARAAGGGDSSKSARSRCASAGCAYSADARRELLDAAVRERRQVVGGAAQRGERRRGPARTAATRAPRCGPRAPRAATTRRRSGPRSRTRTRARRARRRGRPRAARPPGGAGRSRSQSPSRSSSRAVGGVEAREVAVEVARDRRSPDSSSPSVCSERVGEAGRAGGAREAVQRRRRERAAHDERALRVGRDRPLRRGSPRRAVANRSSNVPIVAAEQAAAAARAGRARRGRRPTGSARSDTARRRGAPDSARAGARLCPRSQAPRGGSVPPSHRRAAAGRVPGPLQRRFLALYAAVCAFGRRPRRAAARPGIVPAQSSQRSATFEPRRASRERDPQRRAVRLVDFLPAVVANQNGFPSHISSSETGNCRRV